MIKSFVDICLFAHVKNTSSTKVRAMPVFCIKNLKEMLQWNPDITNTEGNQRIVCYIGSSLNQENIFLGIFTVQASNAFPLACQKQA